MPPMSPSPYLIDPTDRPDASGAAHLADAALQSEDEHSDAESSKSSASESASLSTTSTSSTDLQPAVDEQFLPRVLALFFAIFHPTEGPKVVYQVPEGSVTAEEVGDGRAKGRRTTSGKGKERQWSNAEETPPIALSAGQEMLFDFDTLSDYLIPKAALCGRLVTCTTIGYSNGNKSKQPANGGQSKSQSRTRQPKPSAAGPSRPRYYKVVSYPVLLQNSAKYERNTFIFNLAFVFDGKADVKSYEPVVRKCARALKGLEESQNFLSSAWSQPRMYGVVEQLYQDLNSYCEAFVSLPDAPHTSYLQKQEASERGLQHRRSQSRTSTTSPTMLMAMRRNSLAQATQGLSSAADALLQDSQVTLLPERRRPSLPSPSGVLKPSQQSLQDSPSLNNGSSPLLGSAMTTIPEGKTATDLPNWQNSPSPWSPFVSSDIAQSSQGELSPLGQEAMLPMPSLGHWSAGIMGRRRSETEVSRRSSSASSIQSGAAVASTEEDGRRPSIGRPKTVSTAAVNETQIAGLSARAALTSSDSLSSDANGRTSGAALSQTAHEVMQRALTSGPSAGASDVKASATNHHLENGQPLNPNQVGAQSSSADRPVQNSQQNDAADLFSSVRSLRALGSSDTSEAEPPRTVLPQQTPGQPGAPHGLGRTVREALNIKLFPTYPNPPPVNDWDVPVSLLEIGRRTSGSRGSETSNWDLTMARIYGFINGLNHVKRIAQLADADLELTRQCIEHLLYYGCVLMVDIFQYFNVYALKPAIARMADDPALQAECGPYVTRPGYIIPAWPTLLGLYTALRPGTVLESWIEDRKVDAMGIDVRRFITFGVIKGFLRRVHRYPVLLNGPDVLLDGGPLSPMDELDALPASRSERWGQSAQHKPQVGVVKSPDPRRKEAGLQSGLPLKQIPEASQPANSSTPALGEVLSTSPAKPAKLTERYRKKVPPKLTTVPSRQPTATVADSANIQADDIWFGRTESGHQKTHKNASSSEVPRAFNGSLGEELSPTVPLSAGFRPSLSMFPETPGTAKPSSRRRSTYFTSKRRGSEALPFAPQLVEMLDGTHCEDELCVMFGLSWPQLRRILIQIGKAAQARSRQLEVALQAQQNALSGEQSSSNPTQRESSTQSGEDWLVEMPAFANASGFAGQSGFGGASAWQFPMGPAQSSRNIRPSLATFSSGATIRPYPFQVGGDSGGGRTLSGSGSGVRWSRSTAAAPIPPGSVREEQQSEAAGTAGSQGAKIGSLSKALDDFEIEEDEEELEKKGDFGGVVLLMI